MDYHYVVDIREIRHREIIGRKGAGLSWLSRNRLTIPKTMALTYEACEKIGANGDLGPLELSSLLASHVDPEKRYAVRSSASLEDGKEFSFAGQFLTKTNVQGLAALGEAVRSVIASGKSESIQSYFNTIGEHDRKPQMAVLIQEMIDPILSGVAFSKNPTTGLDEVVIEAVHGLGEMLVQDGATPDRWIYRWGNFTSKPENDQEYKSIIEEVATETRRISRLYGSPVDLEWVYDGEKIYWLQIRPITALDNIPIYSNRISREVLPGVIKPLIASINIPLVNTAWIRLFDSLIGNTGLKPEELARLFHYRAYFNMATVGRIFEILGFPRESLELLLGFEKTAGRPTFRPSLRTFRHIPRLLRFFLRAWNYDQAVVAELQAVEKWVADLQNEDAAKLSQQELMGRIEALYQYNVGVAYQNIVIPILMNAYTALLKRQLKGLAVEYIHFNLTEGLESLQNFDPNFHLDKLKTMFVNLPLNVQERIRQSGLAPVRQSSEFDSFNSAVKEFSRRFGHLSESGNDFSKVPWREDPDGVLRMIINHSSAPRDDQKVSWNNLSASIFARIWIWPIYQRARNFRLRREQISSLYTFSYGWFRVYFLALSKLLKQQGTFPAEDDIFYLSWDEIRSLVNEPARAAEFQNVISVRRDEIEKSRDVILPEIIYGDAAPPLSLMREGISKLTGIPTSPGYFQGRLAIVLSISDFERVKPGCVLAVPYSDVGWTPLFAKAGAVIAEAGGILSHSSIVAREYGIPCVVSVYGACSLPQDCEVVVDGYRGIIQVIG